jgi:hypothetical protein
LLLLLLLWLWWLLLLLLFIVRLMFLPDIQAFFPRSLTARLCPKGSHGGGERPEAMAAAPTRHQDTIDEGHEEAGAYYYAHTPPTIAPAEKPLVQQNQQEAESEEGPSPLSLAKASSPAKASKCKSVKTSILMLVMDRWWWWWLVVWRCWW